MTDDLTQTRIADAALPTDAPAVVRNPWAHLRRHTPARIALGRAGISLPTAPMLDFQLAHAQARDAVHAPLDVDAVEREIRPLGFDTLRASSAAADRHIYLQRPDLGRRLGEDARAALSAARAARRAGGPVASGGADPASPAAAGGASATAAPRFDLAFAVVDGLSSLAIATNAAPFLRAMRAHIDAEGWRVAPVVIATQGRVAIGDEIGELLDANLVIVMIGERPGLSSPDSMGLYLTWSPRPGLTDAARNCISNVRDAGLAHADAAARAAWLAKEAMARGLTGVALKDETASPAPRLEGGGAADNFLLG
ncbi:ethanolamine ammonia-lyase subunit EutC [Derxia gummosa]|uniref:Ethanolamine ammonia-lyase small subunit n=1 Tax=Derxia gummosa DSM 723 TaxID=1121388 RepID=A0A8B6X8L1_9BURK|nr:ethanolamine ammonia-lyase subunit EutC [Derxia gummosa]